MGSRDSEGSGFRFYSFGIVVEDKTDDGDYIKVTPIEDLPHVLGKLSDAKFDYSVSGKDHRGATITSNVKGVAYMVAQWYPFDSGNRNTAPNVCEGETVMILKYASTDQYYWQDMGREPQLRRLENTYYMWSNLEEKGSAYDNDTSYWMRVSTKDQIIQLHTSKNRDEPIGFDITIDTSKGTLQILDTNENELFLNGADGTLVANINESITFNTKRVEFNASESFHVNSPEIIEKGDTISNQSSQSHEIKTDGTANIESESSMTITAQQLQEQAQSISLVSGTPVVVSPGISVG